MFRTLTPRQLGFDTVFAALCFLLPLLTYLHIGGLPQAAILFLMAASLVFRRLAPAIALTIAWAGALLQMALGLSPSPYNLAILLVLFATAAYGSKAVKWVGFASAIVGAACVALYIITFPAVSGFLLPGGGATFTGDVGLVAINTLFAFVAALALFMLSWVLGLLTRAFSNATESRRAQALAEVERLRARQDVTVEQERTRIARDMHDVVAHSLAVVIAQADGARYARKADPEAVDEALTTISSTARDALGDVRVLLEQLRHGDVGGAEPAVGDLGRLLAQMRASGLAVTHRVEGEPGPLATGQQLAVYRIVQEALTNALRHGAGGSAEVTFRWAADALAVTITNPVVSLVAPERSDPIHTGPTHARPAQTGLTPTGPMHIGPVHIGPVHIGHGLAGMRERAVLIGGSLTAGPAGDRFIVSATIPRTGRVSGVATGALPILATGPLA